MKAIAKQWNDSVKYIQEEKLSVWVHNKTIQKARESYNAFKNQLIAEFNELNVAGMPEIIDLCPLNCAYVNLAYPMSNGQKLKLLDDNEAYLGTQVTNIQVTNIFDDGDGMSCFGLVAGMDFLLVSKFGINCANPELVIFKRRKTMELIKLTHENLEKEHICCAISNNKDIQVMSKKNWLADRLEEGLVFLKADVRGKCFIEYIPAEYAWNPIDADGYMYIDCLWVSGQFKGQGYSNLLLDECIRDSKEKGKKGLVVLSSKKKLGFLSDPKYMKYKGFESVDTTEPYFELMYLPFDKKADKPKFKACVKQTSAMKQGFILYYTNQCPFTAKYVPILSEIAEKHNAKMEVVHINSKEMAQNNPSPFTTFSLYYNGEFITHEIQSEKKFEKILAERGF